MTLETYFNAVDVRLDESILVQIENMDRPEERTTFCKRYGVHTLNDLFTCLPPAHPLGFTEAVDSLERSVQHK